MSCLLKERSLKMQVNRNGEFISISGIQDFPVDISYSETFKIEEVIWLPLGTFQTEPSFSSPTKSKHLYYRVTSKGQHSYTSLRGIELDGTFNFRDLGGYTGANGKQVVWGQLFRSDALHQLSPEDQKSLEEMKINTIIDYRSTEEQLKAPDKILKGVRYLNLNPNAKLAELSTGNIQDDEKKVRTLVSEAQQEGAKDLFENRMLDMRDQMIKLADNTHSNQKYRKMFDELLDGKTPIIMHCKGGKDRAGFSAVLVLMALGVSKEDIVYDYMLTAQFMAQRNIHRMDEYRQFTDNQLVLDYLSSIMSTKEIYLEGAFDIIGDDFDKYLNLTIGLSTEELNKLRNDYLV